MLIFVSVFFPFFFWFWLHFDLHFVTILALWSLQNRFVQGHGPQLVSKRPFGSVLG
jgi:hypothetical protein